MQSSRFLLAASLIVAAPSSALLAQGADGRTRREKTVQIEARIERLRRDIVTLTRRRFDAEQLRSEALQDSVTREIDPQIERAARELAALESMLARADQARAAEIAAATPSPELRAQWEVQPAPALSSGGGTRQQPSGWVGISFSGATRVSYGKQGIVFYHDDYPVIESVEPGSPAERAGLEAGDTLLAYDGRDVRWRDIPLGKQLRPGKRLVMRVRHDGVTRDLPVLIERRPVEFVPSFATVTPAAPMRALAPLAPGQVYRLSPAAPRRRDVPTPVGAEPQYGVPPVAGTAPLPAPAAAAAAAAAAATAAAAAVVPRTRVTPAAPMAPPIAWVFSSSGPPAVDGAELAPIVEGLREVFGVPGGVLVLNVATGSPAGSSGLRAGDVVVRVNGAAVTTPAAFQRALLLCRDRAARLDVVRKKRNERVTLRW